MNMVEIFGIVASLVIFISLAMTSIIKLRWINTLGCIFFVIYGFMIGSVATTFLNIGIAIMNLFYLKRLYSIKENFQLVEAERNSEYFKFFIDHNSEDFANFFEKYALENMDRMYYLIRNNSTVGILGWREKGEEIVIEIDYVTNEYRDLKFGKYLFEENLQFFKDMGYKKIVQIAKVPKHKEYVEKIGFKKSGEDRYEKNI